MSPKWRATRNSTGFCKKDAHSGFSSRGDARHRSPLAVLCCAIRPRRKTRLNLWVVSLAGGFVRRAALFQVAEFTN